MREFWQYMAGLALVVGLVALFVLVVSPRCVP
jgi:hypothetical protein